MNNGTHNVTSFEDWDKSSFADAVADAQAARIKSGLCVIGTNNADKLPEVNARLVTVVLVIVHETEKAVLVARHQDYAGKSVWMPKSAIPAEPRPLHPDSNFDEAVRVQGTLRRPMLFKVPAHLYAKIREAL